MSAIRIKDTRADKVFTIVNGILLALVTFICIYPLYFTLIASLSEPDAVLNGRVLLWPSGFTLDSYRSVLRYDIIWRGYLNTIFYTFFGTLWNMFLLLPAAYALSKKELRGRGVLMGIFMFTMFFGGGMIPYYLLIKQLHLINNPLVLILPCGLNVYNMIIARTFFSTSFPQSLAEAARIDGAGETRIFLQIALPLSGAIVAVIALYSAVTHWNSFFNALLFINEDEYYPLQLVLRNILILNSGLSVDTTGMTSEQLADLSRRAKLAETMKYSLIFIANLPVLVAYPFAQKYFVKGVMIGSIKE